MSAWNYAALCLTQCRIDLGHWQYLMQTESLLYSAEAHQQAIDSYRLALYRLIDAAQGELALLPEPEPMPERVAGYVSPSVHG